MANACIGRKPRIQQQYRGDLFAGGTQLLRHLKRDHATDALAAQRIGAMRLQTANFVEVFRSHGLHRVMRVKVTINAASHDAVYRQIAANRFHKRGIERHFHHATVPPRNHEEWPCRFAAFDFYKA